MRSRDIIIIPGLLFIVTMSYLPTLSGQFILDDYPLVKYNPFIRAFHSPTTYLSQEDGVPAERYGEFHSDYYRPFINLLYTMDYKIWGLEASKFRITNLILHLLACLLLYQLLRLFIKDGMAPFWAVLLFGLHPANTETVSWITSRNNIAVTFFGLLSFYFYVKRDRNPDKWAGFLCLLSFTLALLSKEFALMLLPIFFMYDRILAEKREGTKSTFYGYLALTVIVLSYLFLRRTVTQSAVPMPDPTHLLKALYFAPFLIMYNLRIIFFPYGLHCFFLGYPENYFGWEALLGFLGIGFMGWFVWQYRRNRVLLFSWLSLLIALFPVLNVIPTSAVSLVSMRWLYFPMAFLCIAGAWVLNKMLCSDKLLFRSIILGSLTLYLGLYTYVLNENLWKNEERFFKQEVLGFQNDFYLADLATIYHSKGDIQGAFYYFQRALKKKTYARDTYLYINYAALLLDINRPVEALSYLDKAEGLRPSWKDQAMLDNNRGVAYFKMGDYPTSIRYFLRAIGKEPEKPSFLVNLGNAHSAAGRYQKAISLYHRSLELESNHVSAKKHLGITYMKMGDYINAMRTFEEIAPEVRKKNPEIDRMLEEAREKMASVNPPQESERIGQRVYRYVE